MKRLLQHNRLYYTLFVIFACMMIAGKPVFPQSEMRVTGESIKIIGNKKDIHHKRNKEYRIEMIEDAVFDAIERGANIRIQSMINHVQYSSSASASFEEVYEDLLSSSLSQYNVEWRRTSNYEFERVEGKKWKCRVTGIVLNHETDPKNQDFDIKKDDHYFTITRKSFNTVHINAGTNDDIKMGDKIVVYRHKKKKTINGYNFVEKPVGYVTIFDTYDNYSRGHIVKGIYGVKETWRAKVTDFKAYRLGLEYQLAGSYEQVNTTELGEKESTINSKSNALYFYYSSLVSRVGFKLGMEVIDVSKQTASDNESILSTDTSAYVFLPKFNLNYSIGLIPDFLYLVPGASAGYVFFESGKEEIFDPCNKPWNANVTLEGDLSAHLRLRAFDIIGGITYKYINDYPELTNYYPHAGICVNFVRYGRRGIQEK